MYIYILMCMYDSDYVTVTQLCYMYTAVCMWYKLLLKLQIDICYGDIVSVFLPTDLSLHVLTIFSRTQNLILYFFS